MKEIPLSKNSKKNRGVYVALVSDIDYDRVNQHNWSVARMSGNLYAIGTIGGERIRLHRFILGVTNPDILVDHEDRNGLNCQRENLREATNSENQKNKKACGISKYLGVTLNKGVTTKYNSKKFGLREYKTKPKWKAQIKANGNPMHLGLFESEEEAALAYNDAAKLHHGKFARLNEVPIVK